MGVIRKSRFTDRVSFSTQFEFTGGNDKQLLCFDEN